MSELIEAIQAGDTARVRALLEADPSAAAQPDTGGITPLLLTIYLGRADLTALIRAAGVPSSFAELCAVGDLAEIERRVASDPAVVKERSPDGHTAVGLAIFFRHPAVARFLIEHGADVASPSENDQRVAPVHAAAAVCDRATMQLLLDRGADPNARQQADYTAMHGAASRGDVEMAVLLLQHGAERDARGTDGLTAADVARKYDHPAFAEWIDRLPAGS